jgi:hypothetical protein
MTDDNPLSSSPPRAHLPLIAHVAGLSPPLFSNN